MSTIPGPSDSASARLADLESRLAKVESENRRLAEQVAAAMPRKSAWVPAHCTLGEDVDLDRTVVLWASDPDHAIEIGARTKILRGAEWVGPIKVGERCYFNRDSYVRSMVTIGDDVLVGPFVRFVTDSHQVGSASKRAGANEWKPIVVGNGAWIGASSTIEGGVTIGAGALVAAGSVVVSDVPENALVAGVPARVIRILDDGAPSEPLDESTQADTSSVETIGLKPLTTSQLAYYVDQQWDPMTGTGCHRWSLAQVDDGWHLTSTLFVDEEFGRGSPIVWDSVGEEEPQSHALWKYSAGFLTSVLDVTGDHVLVGELIASLYRYNQSDHWRDLSTKLTSLDHLIATRIRMVTSLACQYALDDVDLPEEVFALLREDVSLVMGDMDTFLKTNNHGAMSAIALIHATEVFDGLPGDVPAKAWTRLGAILDEILDEHGLAGENSPGYQGFWLQLLEKLDDMRREWPLEGGHTLPDLDQRAHGVREALAVFTASGGMLLPIGDTETRRSFAEPLAETVFFSAKQGFAVVIDGGVHVTFNCGHTNYAHKHCDDTSVTVTIHGVPMIADGGFYGHDWNDRRVVYSKSQASHSGLFLREFDDLHPGKLYWPGKEVIQGSMVQESTHPLGWRGDVRVADGRTLTRRVTMDSSATIDIEDTAELSDIGGEPVRRFLIPGEADVTIEEGSAIVQRGDIRLRIRSRDPEGTTSPHVQSAVDEPEMRGWLSPRPGQLVAAHCIEFPMPKQGVGRLVVEIV